MISLRLFSNNNQVAGDVLREVLKDRRFGLDIVLCRDEKLNSNLMMSVGAMDSWRKSMHLNHYRYAAKDMIDGMDFNAHHAFLRDIGFASRVDIRNAVLHWTRDGRQCDLPSTNRMREVLSTFGERDVLPFIENLMVGFEWQQKLIKIASMSEQPFGVCFDIGHAKIWGDEPLDVWLRWLDDLHAQNVPLIFHLHGNRGDDDDHLPLWMDEAECEASCVANGFAPGGIIPEIKAFPRRFPGSLFVLETPDEFAMENLCWARQHLMEGVP